MSKSSSSAHGPWQGNSQWWQDWSGARQGWAQNPEQALHERVTTGVHQFPEQISDERVDDGLAHDAGSSTADESHDPAPPPKCAESTQYRKHRRMLPTGPWRPSPWHARKMRGAFMTRSATRQPWPRRTVRMQHTMSLEVPKHSRTTTRR